ncbi:uncharacterized protein A4U43_C02F3700 [Asparagus officinalis]|uniref:non-specific serine/threonine protein kinase n=1 Tax=Asparagus officinalis TaxID=4686 RepID=A0A5P1FJP8_ASPOF|nr:probable LRR receptor-like serine/threonine-protein kinase IRK [Asparagus officinalis]ONK77159.1 uncharacterized protein A4U43_C02F3700 [Asparagus officinalis]
MNSLSLLLLLLLLLLPLLSLSKPPPPLNPDLLGLIVFKSSLLDPTSSLSSWTQDSDDPCNWAHIKCHPESRRVVEISLSSLGLSGKLSRSLLNLQSLQKLSLSNNNFTGFLIPDLTQLPNLTHIDLSSNGLIGEIPTKFFSQCESLVDVNLAGNKLYGQVPSSIGSCWNLVSFNVSSNHLSGSLPDGVLSLSSLESFDVSKNFIVGEIPDGIGKMTSLRSVDFSGNLMSGGIPDSMWKLWMLSYLNLGSNSFSGRVPDWIGEMKWLRVLDFSENGFDGSIPDSIGDLKFLQSLNFSGNGLVGNLPESMRDCSSLLEADFSRNHLMGELPSWLFELGLQKIFISGNKFSGKVQFSNSLGQSLLELDLSGNEFSGEIPMEIGGLWKLELLNLSANLFSGGIPSSLGELKSLEVVDLSVNRLNGSIPLEIAGAASLQELRLQKNFLNGGIPSQIGNCSSLTSLILSQNKLTGSIPTSLANLTNLETVDLSFNSLQGSLPKNLSNLPHLLSFNISHNNFSGPIPPSNFFNTIPPSSLSGNPGLCGSAVNISCPGVLPKPIVLNPNSSSQNPNTNSGITSANIRHKKIILSISAIVAIGAAALIVLGIITITILNLHARSHSSSPSAAGLAPPSDYSGSPANTDANSGKLVMFSGDKPEFASGAHTILNKESELGRGGFGTVYKTVLPDGRPVAIKKLTVSSLVKSQAEFEREIKKIGKMRHPNLVSLQGYYWTPSLQLLIYEFVSGESLHKVLHENSAAQSLTWNERFDIIVATAKSLAHLHRHNIIHYNLKSSNVLIDGSGEPKVGDYGLARLLPMLDRYVLSNKIQSALGYMAPEFACGTVKITDKCDVYGFGVLLLEVVTGRRPVEYTEDDVVVLCDTVRGLVEGGRAEDCVDGRIGGKFPVDEVVPVVKLGLICTSQVPSNRPEMGEVVKILEMIRCPGQDELSSG